MAITNHERVGRAMEYLRQGLAPYIEREIRAHIDANDIPYGLRTLMEDPNTKDKPIAEWDAAALLKVMWDCWNEVFRKTLGPADRSLVSELRTHRNNWAHQASFSSDEAYRALDSTHRLLSAVSAPQSSDIEQMKMELLRLRFDEQTRQQRRRTAGTAIDSGGTGSLRPWREVITPHPDVSSGRYQQAEFAADLWQVHLGQGAAEYRDPVEFFRRTYLTASLKQLLVGGIRRLAGRNGDPVVQLQTNFGGGKTHSMLALYHLFAGVQGNELPGVEELLAEAEETELPAVKRVVLVGNKISPGRPSKKDDGTVINTLWGELAWQLGGKEAYEKVRQDDERATNPGDTLRELFVEYGPCLVLIDEWVAYARQLHDDDKLPGGSFETQFTFAQALTESAKLAENALLVVSLPASDTATEDLAGAADDTEVGGERGRAALARLQNVIGRIASSWQPATSEESFEIVRRRLFQPITDPELFKARDVTARAFADLYREQHQEFPPECREAEYEQRIKAAYPIHPEVFTRLYSDWSTLIHFQRTRGVLRLMASVINSLWEAGDRNPLIMPANIAIDDQRVQWELVRYLSNVWAPILERDVDGPTSLPAHIDGEVPNLGRLHATRRIARTIFLGSAPIHEAANRGLEDRRVKLGSVMPGESPSVFGDALRRLAGRATYLYQDGTRYWYSTQATVTKIAEDRAEQYRRDPDRVAQELDRRLRQNVHDKADFSRIHPLPTSDADVPDDHDARLVVLGSDHAHTREADSPAVQAARAILDRRGTAPRLYQNTLVFLAADSVRLQDLDAALREYLAWDSILAEKDGLDLSPSQVRQAEERKASADSSIQARLPETYRWLLVPSQAEPTASLTIEPIQLLGQGSLAGRAARRLKNDELLVPRFGSTTLRLELDRVPLWRGDHVTIRQLVDDFARYVYLPRLTSPDVLVDAIQAGLGLITWESDSFAYAEGFDEQAGRYRGIQVGRHVPVTDSDPGLLVKPEVACRQLDTEQAASREGQGVGAVESQAGAIGRSTSLAGQDAIPGTTPGVEGGVLPPSGPVAPKRFYGTVTLSPERVGRDAGQIAEEVIAHLSGLVGSKITVTLEIEACIPNGAPEQVVRTVTENAATLKFMSQGFETE